MTDRARATRGALWLTLGNGLGYAASVARNMILARVLSKADFGVAATFGLVLSLFEFTAKMGISRCVIQDKEGDEPAFVATAHTVQLGVSLASVLLILFGSPWLAELFGIREQAWALMMLAGVALCRGLEHVDVRRYERHLRFAPSTLVEIVPQLVVTAAAWPVATMLEDFRAVLVLLLAKSGLSCAMSHLLAEQPYRLSWQQAAARRMLRFGWPLLVTGLLMFAVMQGDQFLVATFYTMSDLAPYAGAVTLAYAPSFLFGGVVSSLLLPLLAKVRDDPMALKRRYEQAISLLALLSAVLSVGMVVGAEALMQVAYGSKYVGTGAILAWLSGALAFRNLRVGPATAALARGDSRNQMISNAWRAIALVPMLGLALQGAPIWMLAACGLIGEATSGWVCVVRLQRRDGIPVVATLRPALWVAVLLAIASLLFTEVSVRMPVWAGLALAGVAALVSGAATVAFLPWLRRECKRAWNAYRAEGWRGALAQIQGLPG